eukprot:66657-Rhodomonas_salina.4
MVWVAVPGPSDPVRMPPYRPRTPSQYHTPPGQYHTMVRQYYACRLVCFPTRPILLSQYGVGPYTESVPRRMA